jgi:arylsulfatase A-like enzyme
VLVHPERRRAGSTSPYFASTHDIAPTMLALAGVEKPRGMDGIDLSPLFDGHDLPERPFAYGGYFNHFYVRTGQWSYVADNHGENRQLFDLTLDPAELHNVARENREVHQELHARLTETIGGLPPYYEGEAVARVRR